MRVIKDFNTFKKNYGLRPTSELVGGGGQGFVIADGDSVVKFYYGSVEGNKNSIRLARHEANAITWFSALPSLGVAIPQVQDVFEVINPAPFRYENSSKDLDSFAVAGVRMSRVSGVSLTPPSSSELFLGKSPLPMVISTCLSKLAALWLVSIRPQLGDRFFLRFRPPTKHIKIIYSTKKSPFLVRHLFPLNRRNGLLFSVIV